MVTGLNLTNYNITESIPPSICDLKNLTMLDLSYNCFTGYFPTILYNCSNLQYLDLSQNYFVGPIPSNVDRLSSSLWYIDVGANSFSGDIPRVIGRLPELRFLKLYTNKFNGSFPAEIGNLSNLEDLSMPYNPLFTPAKIPPEFGKLKKLTFLWITQANLIGEIPGNFSGLSSLEWLDLSSNDLEGPIPKALFQLKNLSVAYLYSNRLTGGIPTPIQSLNLTKIDLSNNNLSGSIPEDFGKLQQLEFLHLHFNLFSGEVPASIGLLPALTTLSLRSNLLQGPLPIAPPFLRRFLISNNSLSGEISSLICSVRYLEILDLSHNKLSGAVPQCLGNFSSVLSVLNLRSNGFTGTIPLAFAKPNHLRSLDLSGNHFEGPLPRSLVNCRSLEVLNVGNNKVNDTFPNWLETLSELQVLVIRSNRFHGPINTVMSEFSFSKLRIVDLSYNEFNGHLPTSYFENFQAMKNTTIPSKQYMNVGDSYYHYSLMVTMKGLEIQLVKILTIFTTIDFSSNNFSGEIPNAIGKLNSLILLNFSHNTLTSHIPASLGNLTNLESLDISFNQLMGKIPSQLTSLTFLAVLNLPWNRLHGPIPRGKQFATFENGSYAGNLGLCGFPLSKECQDNWTKVQPHVLQHEEDDSDFDGHFWKVVVIGFGCGMTLGLFLGSLMFLIGRPRFFVKLAERKLPKKVIRLRRKSFIVVTTVCNLVYKSVLDIVGRLDGKMTKKLTSLGVGVCLGVCKKLTSLGVSKKRTSLGVSKKISRPNSYYSRTTSCGCLFRQFQSQTPNTWNTIAMKTKCNKMQEALHIKGHVSMAQNCPAKLNENRKKSLVGCYNKYCNNVSPYRTHSLGTEIAVGGAVWWGVVAVVIKVPFYGLYCVSAALVAVVAVAVKVLIKVFGCRHAV
ncbi:receptor-like protein 52 [Rhododendron vialii]|uniref:receptor-like protein 52 n=1 Tax=Rhododendron vialii TaxID=182163 RepID=UPI00265FE793|nr:receptor-like protein 52 [Rhododendron vialii]